MEGAADATVTITLQSGMRFDATGADGTVVQLDSDPVHGGGPGGFRPMEMLLVGLGSCTGMDVISILRKKRQKVTAYTVQVWGTQADTYPHVFTELFIRHIFRGNNLSDIAVRRAVELSESKYCPAFAMLQKAAPISSTIEIHPASPPD